MVENGTKFDPVHLLMSWLLIRNIILTKAKHIEEGLVNIIRFDQKRENENVFVSTLNGGLTVCQCQQNYYFYTLIQSYLILTPKYVILIFIAANGNVRK